ncbi:MAG: hypothetical protein ACRC91_23085 [Aeromonas sp.]
MDKFVTVVFKVEDWGKFQAQWSSLCDSMRDESEVGGAVVSGISRYDEMSRVEQLEDLLVENGIEVPQP